MADRKEILVNAIKALEDKKADEIMILDVMKVSSFTDYLIICSGTSDKHVQALASSVEMNLKKKGVRPLGIEGFQEGRWILMDYNDIIIHIFYEPTRLYYDLESLWSDVPRLEP
jgi:ribosome-associated protein